MFDDRNANSWFAGPLSGPFNTLHSLGIDRGNYIAVHSNNPAAAAQYAVENMGLYLVHTDSEGRHYLAAHGLDVYSLVYTPGEQGKLDHISYVVRSADDLLAPEKRLTDLGVKSERIERSQLWRHGPALRFASPGGQLSNWCREYWSMCRWRLWWPNRDDFCTRLIRPRDRRAVDVGATFEFASRVMGLNVGPYRCSRWHPGAGIFQMSHPVSLLWCGAFAV